MRVDEEIPIVHAHMYALEVDVDIPRVERLAVEPALLRIRHDLRFGRLSRWSGHRGIRVCAT